MSLQILRRSGAAVVLMALCTSAPAMPREQAIQEARRLNEQALELHGQGRYPQATPLAQHAVALSEKELGPQHLETARSLDTLAQLYRTTGAHARAEPLYERALAIRQKLLGPEHPETADALNNLALLYLETSAYARAEALHQQALAIREKVLGSQHPSIADSLNNLADVYVDTGAYAKAEALYLRALKIRQIVLGPEHPKTSDSLESLASLHLYTGAYTKAEPLYEQVLAMRQKVLGREHPSTASAFNNLAALCWTTGAYTRAEALYGRALAIYEKALGSQHPSVGDSLDNLAIVYSRTGVYSKAELLFRRAQVIYETALGPEHPRLGASLNNLAILYYKTGAHAKAEPLYQRALVIYEKVLGPEHPRTAGVLNNLASLYEATGAHAKAEPLYQRALAISEKVLGPEHQSTGETLGNLANVYAASGASDKAELLHRRALAIHEKMPGPEHPTTAGSLINLARLYHDAGAYAKAEPLYKRALAIYEKALGPTHPDIVASLNILADLYAATGAYAKAEPLYQRAQIIQAKNSERFLLTGSESRKQSYLQETAKNTHRNVSFSVSVRRPAGVALGLTSVLQYKGRVLDEMSDSVARLRQSVELADRELFEQLAEVANQFSTLTYQGFGNLSPIQYRQRLDELRQRQEGLEAELAKRSAEFRRQVTPVTVDAVRRAIPVGAVLIEWFRYRPFNPGVTRPKDPQDVPRYVAYLLEAGGEPRLVDLGDAQVIETSVREFLQSVQDPTRSDVKERARSLSDRIVKPLRAYLNGAERLLISPDGILNLVPMAALLDENGRYLLQRFEITYLTSGRDVLRMASRSSSQNSAIIIADPDYGKPTRLLAATGPLMDAQRSADLDRSGIVFRPLANTALEAQALKALLKLEDSSVMLRLSATESNLKQLRGPRILHVASHGFFLSDQDLVAGLGPKAEQAMSKGENPLLRAGVALAGANARRSGASEDGILTALEAAQLDLHGTELVVLSACESGVGQVQNGEGVYGLRRALFIAGAQTQITSLWKIADRATGTMMVDYYQRLLAGQGRSAALREAQQRMLAKPQRSHPYFWAGFVPIGNWAPLTLSKRGDVH